MAVGGFMLANDRRQIIFRVYFDRFLTTICHTLAIEGARQFITTKKRFTKFLLNLSSVFGIYIFILIIISYLVSNSYLVSYI